jgi:hypothetical protein
MWDPSGLTPECQETPERAQCLEGSRAVGVPSSTATQYSNPQSLYSWAGNIRLPTPTACQAAVAEFAISLGTDLLSLAGVGVAIRTVQAGRVAHSAARGWWASRHAGLYQAKRQQARVELLSASTYAMQGRLQFQASGATAIYGAGTRAQQVTRATSAQDAVMDALPVVGTWRAGERAQETCK